ncbi:MAG: LLM class F420-dependent oxidoreductase [Dehalococcoidia bacterium]|jgi:probable F420-dependent oxidoreductase|nr:LLM class F420-dependent oxidoreductase [Dehalococcoidia bacterium]
MQLGVVFPQTEIGNDPSVIRDYAQAAEQAGYEHLLAFDHVLGADRDRPGGFQGPYDYETPFHEPFTLFGYLAGVTEQLELVTGVIILPQRQAALVAKQTAQLHALSGGRLRLGVGVGWNAVEFEGLGENFHNRGARIEEQIALMRALWRDPVVSFEGRWHRVTKAGINPLPPGGVIPIWMGGMSDPVIERTGRIADGWFPQVREPDDLRAAVERVQAAASTAGRDPSEIGIEARVSVSDPAAAGEVVERARAFEQAGATHVSVNTMGAQFTPQQHIDAIRAFAEVSR